MKLIAIALLALTAVACGDQNPMTSSATTPAPTSHNCRADGSTVAILDNCK